ncbi:hypothetical protein [Hyphomicrobium sp.]|uniref:hypothetical protein n=1 Tax=Hyphomicrobium sp. TaxID=82 RepID=UPI0025C471A3|nr:hypothetical protein [Hyphomicrobium sp.]MCC7253295.1 hypothetical protein [Hyphomicrobium sp.]
MMKLLLVGIWASIVSLGAAFGMLEWKKLSDPAKTSEAETKIEEFRTKAINVPIIGAGTIQGYMVAQFVFTVDADALKKMQVNPEIYVLDEAFKTIYAGEQVNFQNMKKQDLPLLAKKLGENVNKRLGIEIVQDVLIDQLSYIPKKDLRGASRS